MPPRAIGRIASDELIRFSRPLAGKQLYVTSNPTAIRHILTGRYPNRVTIVTGMRAPDVEGLPMESEALALNEAEDSLLAGFAGATNQLVSAGRLTYAGQRVLIFHSELLQPLGPGPALTRESNGYGWNIYYDDDPNSYFVQGVMLPTPSESRKAYDHVQIARLEEMGDDLAIPRVVSCHAAFASHNEVAAAIADLNDSKFRCEAPVMGKDRQWTVTFHYDCAADAETIDRLTAYAQFACAQCGGFYEGWECMTAR